MTSTRPDQNPQLVLLKPGSETCDICITQLYPGEPDSICDDCQLNPSIILPGTAVKFIDDAIEQETSLSLKKLVERHKIMSQSGK